MDALSFIYALAGLSGGGGGGGGTSDYNDLENKPSINGVTLQGAKSCGDLGIATSTKVAEVEEIAKGAQMALVADDYEDVVTDLNSAEAKKYSKGQNIYVVTLNVPDIWISENDEATSSTYTYTTDAQLIADVEAGGGELQIGKHKISFLETQKVSLTNYVQKTDYATASVGGVIRIGERVSGQSYASGVFTYVAEV